MRKLILLPTALILLLAAFSGCQSTVIDGVEQATFDGKETAIVASR